MSYSRLRRTRRVNNTDSDTEDSFEYNEGDLTTLQTNEALDLEFRIRILSDLLICSLCRGYFRDAMTIKECSHTFCRSCILLKISVGVTCCPVCGTHIGTHLEEDIQRDVTIQNLVDKLFPRFAFEEAREKAELEAIMRNADMEAPTRSKHEDAGSTGLALLDMSLGGPAPLKRTAPLGGWEAGDEWYKHIAKGKREPGGHTI